VPVSFGAQGFGLHAAQDLGIAHVLQAGCTSVGQAEPAGQYAEDQLGSSGQHRVGIGDRTLANAYGTAADLEEQGIVAGPDLDGDRRQVRLPVAEAQLQRQHEPAAAKGVSGARIVKVGRSPSRQLLHHQPELLPPHRELEERRGDGGRRRLPAQDTCLLELPQPIDEQVRRDPGQAVAQIRISAGPPNQQLAHDQQGPSVPYHVESLGYRTVLAIGPHDSTLRPAQRESQPPA